MRKILATGVVLAVVSQCYHQRLHISKNKSNKLILLTRLILNLCKNAKMSDILRSFEKLIENAIPEKDWKIEIWEI
jgi:hypothetical protein